MAQHPSSNTTISVVDIRLIEAFRNIASALYETGRMSQTQWSTIAGIMNNLVLPQRTTPSAIPRSTTPRTTVPARNVVPIKSKTPAKKSA